MIMIFLSYQQNLPRLFPLKENKKTSGSAIVTEEQFRRNFAVFTENQLSQINWNNVLVAGGGVLGNSELHMNVSACLSPLPLNVNGTSSKSLRDYFTVPNYSIFC